MSPVVESPGAPPDPLVRAAGRGDRAAFGALADRHRRELHVHCYRMLGSLEDAEDVVQETFLRAWRGRRGFAGRASYRAWLYRIATNACLDALRRRPRAPEAPDGFEPLWLQPFPDPPDAGSEPEARALAGETTELALLAAIQHLPPRQRAVLILRDALGWSARDTAGLTDMSVVAVNSALQRARAALRQHLPADRLEWSRARAAGPGEYALLDRYMRAIERADTDALLEILHADARLTMPPYEARILGPAAIGEFHRTEIFRAAAGEWRARPTRANGWPAAACYRRAAGDAHHLAASIDVLVIAEGRIRAITAFITPSVFAAFGLPARL